MAPKNRFALLWANVALAAFVLVAVFNFVIDPYGLRVPRWQGINELKHRPNRVIDDIKLASALRQEANALILGNSRADIGFDPRHAGMRQSALRPFNLAVPGSGLETAVRQLETLLAVGVSPRLVVVGIDFMDFLNDKPSAAASKVDRMQDWQGRELHLNLESLFTLTALDESIATLQAQHAAYPATIRVDGFNPMRDYIGLARTDGYPALFRQRGLENARRLKAAKYPGDVRSVSTYAAMEQLLVLARARNIRMELAIYPYHAQFISLFRLYGLLPAFERWKMTLSEAVGQAAADGAPVRLWDFAVLDDRSAEAIPARSDLKADTVWYWEAGHFKSALGGLVLDRMLMDANPSRPGFGRLLAPGHSVEVVNLDQRLSGLLLKRRDLAQDLAEIERAVR